MRVIAIATLLFASAALAAPSGPPPIEAMTSASDLVIVGKVLSSTSAKDVDHTTVETFELAPTRILKGSLSPRVVARVYHTRSMNPTMEWDGADEGVYGMFFLKFMPQGSYTLANPHVVSLPAVPGVRPEDSPAASPVARVATELASVFTVPILVLGNPAVGLMPNDYLGGENVYKITFETMQSIAAPIALPALDHAISVAAFPGVAWARALELSLGRTEQLKTLYPLMANPDHASAPLRKALAVALADAKFTDADIPLLARLLQSKDHGIRLNAVEAIDAINTRATVLPLESAIDSSDKSVADLAVGYVCLRTEMCEGLRRVLYFRQPENHPQLRALVQTWEKQTTARKS